MSRASVGLGIALLGAALLVPVVIALPYPRDVLIRVFLFATLAQAWNILAGYCGQISLGHAIFFGTGAYTSGMFVANDVASPWVAMVVGAVLAVALSQLIGAPVFRLRGHYFAIATIAVGEIVHILAVNWELIGAARGLYIPIKRPDSLVNFQFHQSKAVYYYIVLGLLVLGLAITRLIERSRLGYYFRAVREEQDAAASLGVRVARTKRVAFAISAALTAACGTFYAQYVLFIDPESVFPLSLSILICLVAVLGGVGTLWGPLLGAAVLIPLGEVTRIYLGGTGKALDLVIYGALIMVISVVQPAGLVGMLRRLRRAA
ncbi:MAG TPA: branched-chain amino acid ABC transporter permease [Vicinamibacterales bacterium]|jgi:branched-chain amino acid transport system permease protein|nr:branched-chain amino acid ABC transporter permease [Vicinamibacterales bacterium]